MTTENATKNVFFFGFFLSFLPIFISVDFNNLYVTFSRPGPYYDYAILNGNWKSVYDNVISEYYVTAPLSLLYLFFLGSFFIFRLKFFFQSKAVLFISNLSIFVYVFFAINICIFFYIGVSISILLAFFLVLSTVIMSVLLNSVATIPNAKFFFNILKCSLIISIFLGFIASLLYVISDSYDLEYVQFPGEIIPSVFSIYNFEQYFILSPILLFIYLYINNQLGLFFSVIVFSILVFVALVSGNDVSILSLIFIGLLIINNKIKLVNVNTVNFMLIFIGLFLLIAIPIFSYFIFEYYNHLVGNPALSGIWSRVFIYHQYVDMINFSNILFPLSLDAHSNISDPHNQLLTLIVHGGFFYTIFFYFLILFFIFQIDSELRAIFIYYSVVLGCVVEPLLHPFILVQFVMLLSLSIVMNRMKLNNIRS